MNNRSQFAIVRYTMKLNNLKLHAHDLREGKRSAISSLVNANIVRECKPIGE